MVETMAVIGTYDHIAERVWRRYQGLATRAQFGIPIENPRDLERLGDLVRALQRGFGDR